MSAGAGATPKPDRDLTKLAPRFRVAVERALYDCHADGLDVWVYEGLRSPELQAAYYRRGRTEIPPHKPVTNAKSNLYSWHGFGLAVDVISQSRHWYETPQWFARVAEHFKRHGCKWGGDWKMRDLPHMQWGRCKASPSDRARVLFAEGGFKRVWEEVGAL